jgi:Tfp pilus assembly protein PilE
MRASGITLVESLTVVVVLVVLGAVAIPLWRTHELRAQRAEAMQALLAVQSAQDRHFGAHARYAAIEELPIKRGSRHFTVEIERGDDQLSYVATARATRSAAAKFDARCAQLSIDQHGRRFALNDSGEDSTEDCWNRK